MGETEETESNWSKNIRLLMHHRLYIFIVIHWVLYKPCKLNPCSILPIILIYDFSDILNRNVVFLTVKIAHQYDII